MYRYELYGLCSDLKTRTKYIYRKKPITEEERREKLAGNYADYLAEKYNTSVVLYGCNERGEI